MNYWIIFFGTQMKKILANFIYLMACLVPKKRGLILFGAWFGKNYSDNPRYIYEFALDNGVTNIYWITKNKKLYAELQLSKRPALYAYSLRGLWLQMRAAGVVFSHSHWSDFCSSCIGPKTVRVQAWHGAPLKRIGKDNDLAKKSYLREFLSSLLFPYMKEKFDLILATGELDKGIFARAFSTPLDKIKVTGYPRNDVFSFSDGLLSKRPKKILYMPTFRGAPGSVFKYLEETYFDFSYVETELEGNDAILYIKLHPVQRISGDFCQKVKGSKRIKLIDQGEDVYPFLNSCDALLTDYSSIFFDFLLSGKPIFMLPLDIEDYINDERLFYYPYEQVCPSEPQLNWMDMLRYIFKEPYPLDRHAELFGRFHVYSDRGASKRAYEQIISLIKARV